jgi:hypothetical protein
MYSKIIHVSKIDNSPGYHASKLSELVKYLKINGYYLSFEIELYKHYRKVNISSEFFTVYLIMGEEIVEQREFSNHGDKRDS